MFQVIKAPFVAAILASASLLPAQAFAGSVTLSLVRSSLSNDADSDGGGLWQYEGGAVQNKTGDAIGTYIVQRRVTTSGTQPYNTAGETISVFLAPSDSGGLPPVITVEGNYSYNSGAVGGSVSAASTKYHWIIGSDASATIASGTATTKLVITWTGSDGLHVP
jgi:hypothetical protein